MMDFGKITLITKYKGLLKENMERRIADIPTSMKGLRACLGCRLVKTEAMFLDDGCENCGEIESISDTTPVFHGLIASMRPGQSWVARWKRQDKQAPGLYAISVHAQQRN